MKSIKAAVAKFEASKLGQQVFRVVRIAGVGVAAYALTHNGLAGISLAAIVEAAFRQVFPVSP